MALHGRTLVFMLVGLNCIATSLQQSYVGNGYFQGYELKDMNVKKKECLTVTSECYTTEQCCSDLACVDTNNDGISGKCLAKKRLRRCTESIQCGEMTTCSSVIGSNSKYCVPDKLETSYDFARDFKDKMYNSQSVYSRNYDTQAYGTLLLRKPGSKGTGMPCISTDDCQMTDSYSGDPLCCQKISQGKMGSKLKCHTIINVDDCKPWSN